MLELPEIFDAHYCSQCSHRTESVFQLKHHIHRNHRNVYAVQLYHAIVKPEQFSCIYCNHNSYYRSEMYEHYKQIHTLGSRNNENEAFCEGLVKYSCGHCRYESDSSLSLAKHNDLCDKKLLTSTRKPQGIAEGTKKVVSPDLDGAVARRTVKEVGKMKPKMVTHEKIEWFRCNHCSYRTNRKSNLKVHNTLKHCTEEEIDWFQCNDCPYRAKQKSCLKRHSINKHATKNVEINWFRCKDCSYRSKLKSHLQRHHTYRHATIEEIKWFLCSHCSYRAKEKSQLKNHNMLKHATNDEISWLQCNHCSYRAKKKSHLGDHMIAKHATDEEINWFQCNHCSYRAKLKPGLKKHMLKHRF